MGKKSGKKNKPSGPSEPTGVKEEVKTEVGATAEQRDIVKKLTTAAKKDAEQLSSETADQVRDRLAKSQIIAREIMSTLKAERERCMQLEALLLENKIEVPPREPIVKPAS
mmetsp:Transcript_30685/g.42498  ORF Transcript_30685/g.42498 Transcript_30685/m.42498 type:complete len:111 (+) Transcript_30685:195-527(+)|eukprot:CAMPEP_0196570830 /NCGR_PEP_ID=MMETSP1081-20130531/1019_1 /TAXON_ID=36882 /ORGANISM="Pyramimonas amylifera, Strain CCMP720" /LENGTH=110 /DNA_ID=CAMNT_0041887509 /DNA_START=188 /DNA_END=520 /DNA_ORIENTATION=+